MFIFYLLNSYFLLAAMVSPLSEGFELLFDGAVDPEKFEIVPALHHLIRLFRKMLRQGEFEIVCLLFLLRPLVCAGLDLVQQNVAGPSELCGGGPARVRSCGLTFSVFHPYERSPGSL